MVGHQVLELGVESRTANGRAVIMEKDGHVGLELKGGLDRTVSLGNQPQEAGRALGMQGIEGKAAQ